MKVEMEVEVKGWGMEPVREKVPAARRKCR